MIGIQIYTVRDRLTDDAAALDTMKVLKKIGYECVQLSGSMEMMERAARAAEETGLKVLGLLTDPLFFAAEKERLFALSHRYGAGDVCISSGMKTKEEALSTVSLANDLATQAKGEGFTFSYHNHSNEFIRAESGETLMQLLLEGFAPEIRLMPDTYWLQHGGVDVRDFLKKTRARAHILHLKDMKRTKDGPTFAEIGMGNLNFEGILPVAREAGYSHYIVEQDTCDGDSLRSAAVSYENLTALFGRMEE